MKFEEGNEETNLEGKVVFSYRLSNAIKSIEISDNTVIYQYGDFFDTYCRFGTLEPGKSIITFTDIYEQKISSTVVVTDKNFLQDISLALTTSTIVDNTMPSAMIRSIHRSDTSIWTTCSEELADKGSCDGFEGYLSFNSDFSNYIQVKDSVRFSDESGILGFQNIMSGRKCYLKVRSYIVQGNVKIVGPWSKTMEIDMLSQYYPSDEQTKYTYEIYGVDRKQTDFYSGLDKVVYRNTDNPDEDAFDILCNNKSVMINKALNNNTHFYQDVIYEGDKYESFARLKVKGGYITHLRFDEPGIYTVEIREYSATGYTTAKNVTLNVLDYEQEKMKWMQDIIDKTTTSNMTPFEKMDAVTKYLRTPGLFRYRSIYENKLVQLAAQPNTPFFISYRWDSATSPSALCEFAKLIGGFDDIHDCYGDYYRGTDEWYMWHASAKLTIGDEVQYYEVCPDSSTGTIDQIDMIDFSDVSNFRKFS